MKRIAQVILRRSFRYSILSIGYRLIKNCFHWIVPFRVAHISWNYYYRQRYVYDDDRHGKISYFINRNIYIYSKKIQFFSVRHQVWYRIQSHNICVWFLILPKLRRYLHRNCFSMIFRLCSHAHDQPCGWSIMIIKKHLMNRIDMYWIWMPKVATYSRSSKPNQI